MICWLLDISPINWVVTCTSIFLKRFSYFLVILCGSIFQCSDKLGLSLELGSFVAGVMISTTEFTQHTLNQVYAPHPQSFLLNNNVKLMSHCLFFYFCYLIIYCCLWKLSMWNSSLAIPFFVLKQNDQFVHKNIRVNHAP